MRWIGLRMTSFIFPRALREEGKYLPHSLFTYLSPYSLDKASMEFLDQQVNSIFFTIQGNSEWRSTEAEYFYPRFLRTIEYCFDSL